MKTNKNSRVSPKAQNPNIPVSSSNSLLRTNHTKQFAREEPTHERMNQQGSAKPANQEWLQAAEAQAGTTGGWFSDTHKHLLKHLLL